MPDTVPVRVTLSDVTKSNSLRHWRLSSFGFKWMGLKESLAILNAEAIYIRSDMLALQAVFALQEGLAGDCWWCQC